MSTLAPDEFLSGEDPDAGSEFSGVGGLIQPPPHNPADSARESLWLLRANAEHE